MLSKLTGIPQPSERQFVLIDNTMESELPTQFAERIPLVMWIDYQGKGGLENPPSIALLINPATMTTALTKKINPSFTRGGFVVENWGDNLDVLNFSGTIGAYYVKSNSTAGTGLNRYDRSKSFSFRNLMEVFLIYRNNGSVYSNMTFKDNKTEKAAQGSKLIEGAGTKTVSNINSMKTTKTRIVSLGDVYLQYDRTLYMGSFDTLSIEEDATKPFTLNYNFAFTVLRKHVSDNRTELYYNQVALDFEDRLTSRRGGSAEYKAAIQKAIETTKNTKDQESLTNPVSFTKNVSSHNVPAAATAYAVKLLGSGGYEVNETQKAKLENSFKELSGNYTYKDFEKTKEDIYKINKEIISSQGKKGEEEASKEARDKAEAETQHTLYLKGAK